MLCFNKRKQKVCIITNDPVSFDTDKLNKFGCHLCKYIAIFKKNSYGHKFCEYCYTTLILANNCFNDYAKCNMIIASALIFE